MECPRCRKNQADDARFCESCGAALGLRCPSCGREVGRSARFCAGCGVALEATPSATPASAESGERRQLTVLFCDLVRSSEISARLDPEEWGAALAAYQKAGDAVITRYDGHVAQHLGDGLLAYFGWPQAMDDAPERAVRAGLALVEAAAGVRVEGRPLAARVGIHTGAVVMGALGHGASAETLALGDVPNVAARVQTAAEPGTVVITESTQRLVAGMFVIDEHGALALPGASAPVRLHRVRQASGVRGRIHAAATARRLTRFVGRELERQLLRERWELAQEGEGQVVLITGEPGIGKSRLVQQLKQELASEPHTWIESAGSPYLQHTPFAVIPEMLAQGFQWPEDLPSAERVASLERVLAAVGMRPEQVVPQLAPLLGLALPERYPPVLVGPEEQRRRLLSTMVDWTLASARLQPTVVVIEDLHWLDASTLELQGLLADQVATARVLLILTARPEFRASWPLRAHHAQLSLARLSRRQTHELIGAVTAGVIEQSELAETLVALTDGVPLFVEELTRAVAESGVASAREIPATLQDTLMARLDRLGDAKAVAQVGAVLGREFAYGELVAVAERPASEIEAGLSRLCDAELLHARGLGAEATYSFKHALMQQAAYESLLKSRRRELHRRAAAVLSRSGDRRQAVLAHHWEVAGEAERALAAWQAAAEEARRSAASFEAAEHYRRALALVATLPESAERDRQELTLTYPLSSYLIIAKGPGDPELQTVRARAKELAERVGDATSTVNVLSGLWAGAFVRGEMRSALAIATQMLEIAERHPAPRPLVLAHADKAVCHFQLGELAASREHSERVLELYDEDALRDDPMDRRVLVLSYLMQGALRSGRFHDYRRTAEELLAVAQSRGVMTDLALARTQIAQCEILRREPARVAALASELGSLCAEHKLEMFASMAKIYSGWATAQLGDGERGIASIRDGLHRADAQGQQVGRALRLSLLAEAHAISSRFADGAAALEDAFGALREEEVYRPDLLRLQGDLLAQRGEDLAAEAAFREAIQRAKAMDARLIELRASTALARLLLRSSRFPEAREILAPIYASFDEGLEARDLVEARTTLDAIGAPRATPASARPPRG